MSLRPDVDHFLAQTVTLLTPAGAEGRYREQIDQLLSHIQDLGTGHGDVGHWGVPLRSRPNVRRTKVMSFEEWGSYEAVQLNTSTANGPGSYRRLQGISQEGPTLPVRCIVLDMDESKSSTPRSLEELIQVLPPGWTCIVPTKTTGNYQFVYAISPQSREKLSALRLHVAAWGGDPNLTNSLVWNPVHRTKYPRATDQQRTIWWNDRAEGPMPVVDDLAHFHHPDVPPLQEGSNSFRYGTRASKRGMVEAMSTMVEGDGRFKQLTKYVGHMGSKARIRLGRDLAEVECLDVAREGNEIYLEPLDVSEVANAADYYYRHQGEYSERQRKRSHSRGAVEQRIDEKNAASRRYFQALDTQRILREAGGGNRPNLGNSLVLEVRGPSLWDGYRFSDEEQERAANFTGRWGSYGHVAYVLGWTKVDRTTGQVLGPDSEKVRKILSNGEKKRYSRRLASYPAQSPPLPIQTRSEAPQPPVVFGITVAQHQAGRALRRAGGRCAVPGRAVEL